MKKVLIGSFILAGIAALIAIIANKTKNDILDQDDDDEDYDQFFNNEGDIDIDVELREETEETPAENTEDFSE